MPKPINITKLPEFQQRRSYWQGEIDTLTERLAANEVVYGPGCRPELRERLAEAETVLAGFDHPLSIVEDEYDRTSGYRLITYVSGYGVEAQYEESHDEWEPRWYDVWAFGPNEHGEVFGIEPFQTVHDAKQWIRKQIAA
jgi:hypothetical protein